VREGLGAGNTGREPRPASNLAGRSSGSPRISTEDLGKRGTGGATCLTMANCDAVGSPGSISFLFIPVHSSSYMIIYYLVGVYKRRAILPSPLKSRKSVRENLPVFPYMRVRPFLVPVRRAKERATGRSRPGRPVEVSGSHPIAGISNYEERGSSAPLASAPGDSARTDTLDVDEGFVERNAGADGFGFRGQGREVVDVRVLPWRTVARPLTSSPTIALYHPLSRSIAFFLPLSVPLCAYSLLRASNPL
jgi:hypothetical protein